MSWEEKMKEWGGGDIAFLSEDGEAIVFIVVGEPQLLEGKFKGRVSQRIGCPVVTAEGYTLFICGKRLARRLSKHEGRFGKQAFVVVRRGEHNDIETTYELSICEDAELTARLYDYKKKEFSKDMVADSVTAAKEVMKQ